MNWTAQGLAIYEDGTLVAHCTTSPEQAQRIVERLNQVDELDASNQRWIAEALKNREAEKALLNEREQLRRTLLHLKSEAGTNLDCNHPGDDGGDDLCDGEDCIHCHIIATVDAALAASEPSTP